MLGGRVSIHEQRPSPQGDYSFEQAKSALLVNSGHVDRHIFWRIAMQESDSLEQRECVLQLAERIGELPPIQKKLLAMYYFENLPLAEIAAQLGLSKIVACQILVETSARLLAIRRVPLLKMVKNVTTDQEAVSHEIQYGGEEVSPPNSTTFLKQS
jgi:predicted DNA-binding protein YlxM (UPF0122 family)